MKLEPNVQYINVESIIPNRFQPRLTFDENALNLERSLFLTVFVIFISRQILPHKSPKMKFSILSLLS